MVVEVLATAVRQEKGKERIEIGEEIKFSLFADDMILYIQCPKNSTKRLEMINESSKIKNYKINVQKSTAFLNTNNEAAETEIKKTNPIYNCTKSNKIPRNTLNQGDERPTIL